MSEKTPFAPIKLEEIVVSSSDFQIKRLQDGAPSISGIVQEDPSQTLAKMISIKMQEGEKIRVEGRDIIVSESGVSEVLKEGFVTGSYSVGSKEEKTDYLIILTTNYVKM